MTVAEFKTLAESRNFKTPENCDYDQLERKFWKLLLYNPPIYGADVPGSLTDDDVEVSNCYKCEYIFYFTYINLSVFENCIVNNEFYFIYLFYIKKT